MTEISKEDLQKAINALDDMHGRTKSLLMQLISDKDAPVWNNAKNDYDTIRQVLEDRLNQPTVANNASVDWKSIAEEMYDALKSASTYISQNNPHWSAPYHNETTRKIIGAISKYEQAIKGDER